jgi:pseudouridine kinase
MTEREKEIFELIEKNPMISQAEIAILLTITRASVAVHISNLVKKGYVKGKGYILSPNHPVTVIGGANVDIQGKPYNDLIPEDSNPGLISQSLGGVGRNIAENMSKLGLAVRLLTAIGRDDYGQMIKDNAYRNGIDIEDCLTVSEVNTSTYMYVLNEMGDMVVAISDMAIMDQINEKYLSTKQQKIDKSSYTVIDANLSKESICYLANHLHNTKLILDTVSSTKALRAKEVLHRFYAIKPNRIEAEKLLDMTLDSDEAIIEAGRKFLSMGIKKVIITLGSKGLYYADDTISFFRQVKSITPINATGAGDAFTAALVYGLSNNLEPEALVDVCTGAAVIAMMSEDTIAKDLTIEEINEANKPLVSTDTKGNMKEIK